MDDTDDAQWEEKQTPDRPEAELASWLAGQQGCTTGAQVAATTGGATIIPALLPPRNDP